METQPLNQLHTHTPKKRRNKKNWTGVPTEGASPGHEKRITPLLLVEGPVPEFVEAPEPKTFLLHKAPLPKRVGVRGCICDKPMVENTLHSHKGRIHLIPAFRFCCQVSPGKDLWPTYPLKSAIFGARRTRRARGHCLNNRFPLEAKGRPCKQTSRAPALFTQAQCFQLPQSATWYGYLKKNTLVTYGLPGFHWEGLKVFTTQAPRTL